MDRPSGLSVRLRLTLSYAGFLLFASGLLLMIVLVFLLRYVPEQPMFPDDVWGPPGPSRSDLWEAFAPRAAVALAFLLVVGLVGGWVLAGRMLAPLTRITAATRRATAGSLSHRIWMTGRNDEFRELADAFDVMLEQLEAHVGEQQRFAANASHELRTPLAIMQTVLDVARSDPQHPASEVLDTLHTVNGRAIDLTEALLLLSRADRRSFTREPVDLSLAAEEASETLLPLAEKRGLTIDVAGGVATTVGSPALLLQMTVNLVHNAIIHNVPERGSVWITTSRHSGRSVLTVENTGDPLTRQFLATMLEPFQRGSRRTHRDHAGVGLGLAIVQSIVAAHGGTLTLAPRPAGGLIVTVKLPATSLGNRSSRPDTAR